MLQLNAVVTLLFAVLVLREPCTMLQVGSAVLMVAGCLVAQRASQPVTAGKLMSITGACAVSIDTDLILAVLPLPQALAAVLRTQL